jgi:type I restriction enzyme S subunit
MHEEENLVCGYHLAMITPKSSIQSSFLFRAIQSSDVQHQFSVEANGITRYGLSYSGIKDAVVPVPTLEEQFSIATFLDQKTAQIDTAISQKEQLIELLKERKQIIIQRAVTRGLDETVKMKDSGVDWIGEVPGHWEVKRLKYLFSEFNERSEAGEETLLSLRMVQGLVPHNDVSDIHISKQQLTGYKKVAPGDLVMNRMRAAIGLFGVVRQHGLVSPDYSTFSYNENVSEQFYLRLFKTETYCRIFRLNSRGLGTGSSGFMRLYGEDFGNIPAPLPSREEQEDILNFINEVEGKIGRAIGLHQTQITKLKEYKTVLIDAAVTGKIKVG